MALTSSVPQLSFTPAGVVLPTEDEILAGVVADINAAFGGNLNPALETPQGQFATSIAAAIAAKNNEIAYLVNQLDPRYSSYRFQDAIGHLYFMTRKPALPTMVDATVTGVPGTYLAAGVLAADTSNHTYELVDPVSIPSGGSAPAVFACTVPGPTPCPAGSLNVVYQAVPGWDAVTNAADGAVGREVESRSDFEYRRKNSVGVRSTGSPAAIRAAVFEVPGVVDVFVYNNMTSSAVTAGGVTIAANSVYVSVAGTFSSAAVGSALLRALGAGCGMTGTTSVSVTDPTLPGTLFVPYTFKYTQALGQAVYMVVNIADFPTRSAATTDAVKAAIIARFNGTDGGDRVRIGAPVYGSNYAQVVADAAGSSVVSIFVGATSSPTTTAVSLSYANIPYISDFYITVNYV